MESAAVRLDKYVDVSMKGDFSWIFWDVLEILSAIIFTQKKITQ